MKIRNGLWAAAMLAVAAPAAQAGEVLFDSSGFLKGQQSFVQSFDIKGPGLLTVTLSNVTWPERLANLSLLISDATGLLTPQMGEGTASIEITSARNIYAQWFGQAQGPLNIGVYAMKIEFQPYDVVPVPLPTSMALLLSGMGLLAWQRRNRDGNGFSADRAIA